MNTNFMLIEFSTSFLPPVDLGAFAAAVPPRNVQVLSTSGWHPHSSTASTKLRGQCPFFRKYQQGSATVAGVRPEVHQQVALLE
jgi:hypothetical protein